MKAHMELHITNTTATILALINTAVTCTGLKKNHDYLKWHGFLKLLLMSNMLFKQTTWKHSPMCYSLLEGVGGGGQRIGRQWHHLLPNWNIPSKHSSIQFFSW